MHQLVEYILGGALVASGMQSPTPAVPAVVGALIAVHAAFTVGPLAAFRVVSRRAHRVIDIGVIAVEVAAAAQPWIECEGGTRMIIAAIAAVHAFVWWRTNFAQRPSRAERRSEQAAPRPLSPADLPADRATSIGRSAGRLAGRAVNAARARRANDG